MSRFQFVDDHRELFSVKRLCHVLQVSRSGYYRWREAAEARAARRRADAVLAERIRAIHAGHDGTYGSPRITAELRRRGWKVNPKRVYRLMREDNLLCVRKRKFVVTTDSNHSRKVYPNLAGEMVLTGIDQLWVADITYIRCRANSSYLAVVIDALLVA